MQKCYVFRQSSKFCHILFQNCNCTIFILIFARSSLCFDEKRNKCAFLTGKTFSRSPPPPFSHPILLCTVEKATELFHFAYLKYQALILLFHFSGLGNTRALTSGNLQPRSFQWRKWERGGGRVEVGGVPKTSRVNNKELIKTRNFLVENFWFVRQ